METDKIPQICFISVIHLFWMIALTRIGIIIGFHKEPLSTSFTKWSQFLIPLLRSAISRTLFVVCFLSIVIVLGRYFNDSMNFNGLFVCRDQVNEA